MEEWRILEGHQNPCGLQPGAYDAERAGLARPMESASRRNTTPERVTISTDAPAATKQVFSEEPGPGRTYELQGGKGRVLSSRSVGVRPTTGSKATSRPMSGRTLRRRCQTPTWWNGSDRHRSAVMPSAQRSRWHREGR